MYAIRSYYENAIGMARIVGYSSQGAQVLAHGALAEHLSGKEEIEAVFSHVGARLAKHHGVAIDTGVHVAAIAIFRVFQHLQVDVADIPDQQRDTDLLGGFS